MCRLLHPTSCSVLLTTTPVKCDLSFVAEGGKSLNNVTFVLFTDDNFLLLQRRLDWHYCFFPAGNWRQKMKMQAMCI